jgi:hypothetical protein
MQPHLFSKRQLGKRALKLGEEEINAALGDETKRYVGSQVFQKQKMSWRILDPV